MITNSNDGDDYNTRDCIDSFLASKGHSESLIGALWIN